MQTLTPGTPPSNPWGTPAPKKKRTGRKIAIGAAIAVAGIAIIAVAGGGNKDTADKADAAPAAEAPAAEAPAADTAEAPAEPAPTPDLTEVEEVTLTSCAPDEYGIAVMANGQAVNTSSKRSNYSVELTVTAADGTQIGTGFGYVENVEPGQTAVFDAYTDTDTDRWTDGAVCKIVDVERNAAY